MIFLIQRAVVIRVKVCFPMVDEISYVLPLEIKNNKSLPLFHLDLLGGVHKKCSATKKSVETFLF